MSTANDLAISAGAAALRGPLSGLRDLGHGCPAASGRLLHGAVGRAGAQHGGDLRIPLHWDFIAFVGVGVSRPAKSRSTARRWEAEMTVERGDSWRGPRRAATAVVIRAD